ncbi:MAG: hypothetical protein ABI743_15385, partial [bacterium]
MTYDDHDLSPVSQVPRLTGDEVDDARLIAKLHAAIAKETGPFALPWYQQQWAKGAMGALALVTVVAVSFSSGMFVGKGTVDRGLQRDPVLSAWLEGVRNQHMTPQQVDAGVDALLDNIGPGLDASEQ